MSPIYSYMVFRLNSAESDMFCCTAEQAL